jgi:hypothetical protein
LLHLLYRVGAFRFLCPGFAGEGTGHDWFNGHLELPTSKQEFVSGEVIGVFSAFGVGFDELLGAIEVLVVLDVGFVELRVDGFGDEVLLGGIGDAEVEERVLIGVGEQGGGMGEGIRGVS